MLLAPHKYTLFCLSYIVAATPPTFANVFESVCLKAKLGLSSLTDNGQDQEHTVSIGITSRALGKKGRASILTPLLHSSPGKSQDDATMYGQPSKEGVSATDPTQATPTSTLDTKPEAEKKDKGVLRQIL